MSKNLCPKCGPYKLLYGTHYCRLCGRVLKAHDKFINPKKSNSKYNKWGN